MNPTPGQEPVDHVEAVVLRGGVQRCPTHVVCFRYEVARQNFIPERQMLLFKRSVFSVGRTGKVVIEFN